MNYIQILKQSIEIIKVVKNLKILEDSLKQINDSVIREKLRIHIRYLEELIKNIHDSNRFDKLLIYIHTFDKIEKIIQCINNLNILKRNNYFFKKLDNELNENIIKLDKIENLRNYIDSLEGIILKLDEFKNYIITIENFKNYIDSLEESYIYDNLEEIRSYIKILEVSKINEIIKNSKYKKIIKEFNIYINILEELKINIIKLDEIKDSSNEIIKKLKIYIKNFEKLKRCINNCNYYLNEYLKKYIHNYEYTVKLKKIYICLEDESYINIIKLDEKIFIFKEMYILTNFVNKIDSLEINYLVKASIYINKFIYDKVYRLLTIIFYINNITFIPDELLNIICIYDDDYNDNYYKLDKYIDIKIFLNNNLIINNYDIENIRIENNNLIINNYDIENIRIENKNYLKILKLIIDIINSIYVYNDHTRLIFSQTFIHENVRNDIDYIKLLNNIILRLEFNKNIWSYFLTFLLSKKDQSQDIRIDNLVNYVNTLNNKQFEKHFDDIIIILYNLLNFKYNYLKEITPFILNDGRYRQLCVFYYQLNKKKEKLLEINIELLKNDIELLKNDIELLKNDIELLKNDIELINNDIELLKNDIELINNDIELLKNDIELLKNDNELLKNDIELINNDIELQNNKFKLQKNKALLKHRIYRCRIREKLLVNEKIYLNHVPPLEQEELRHISNSFIEYINKVIIKDKDNMIKILY